MEVSPSTPTTEAAALTWMLAMRRHRRRQCAGDVSAIEIDRVRVPHRTRFFRQSLQR
jgi:hypothetical protein